MKKNIVLTGLMGVGKTTIGRLLSNKLSMPFMDADEEIEKRYGPIPGLFQKGEGYFRDIESEIIKELATKEGIILSTGGGVVLRAENMKLLAEKGVIFYLTRSIEEIMRTVDTLNRPLLKDGPEALLRLQGEREPLYRKYCDHVIDASDMDGTVKLMVSLWKKDS